ncbi:MAG: hypothetical protein JO063_09530 [Pseudonocardiales bacterium]|nr:hypothetical protein [Pseudonocardiales bacterium]
MKYLLCVIDGSEIRAVGCGFTELATETAAREQMRVLSLGQLPPSAFQAAEAHLRLEPSDFVPGASDHEDTFRVAAQGLVSELC